VNGDGAGLAAGQRVSALDSRTTQGPQYRGDFEDRLKAVPRVSDAEAKSPVLDDCTRSGLAAREGRGHAPNLLKPSSRAVMLARGRRHHARLVRSTSKGLGRSSGAPPVS